MNVDIIFCNDFVAFIFTKPTNVITNLFPINLKTFKIENMLIENSVELTFSVFAFDVNVVLPMYL